MVVYLVIIVALCCGDYFSFILGDYIGSAFCDDIGTLYVAYLGPFVGAVIGSEIQEKQTIEYNMLCLMRV